MWWNAHRSLDDRDDPGLFIDGGDVVNNILYQREITDFVIIIIFVLVTVSID